MKIKERFYVKLHDCGEEIYVLRGWLRPFLTKVELRDSVKWYMGHNSKFKTTGLQCMQEMHDFVVKI